MNIFTFFLRKLKQKLFRIPLYKFKFNINTSDIYKNKNIYIKLNDSENNLILDINDISRKPIKVIYDDKASPKWSERMNTKCIEY